VLQERQCRQRAMQGDGKIVVAGNSFIDGGNMILRLSLQCKWDSRYDIYKPARATADFGAHDLGHSVAVHGDGRSLRRLQPNEAKNNVRSHALRQMEVSTRSFNGTGKIQYELRRHRRC